jgi:hypothetical protein
VWLDEWVVDRNNVDIVMLDGIAEDDPSNTTEAVDSDLEKLVSSCEQGELAGYQLTLTTMMTRKQYCECQQTEGTGH